MSEAGGRPQDQGRTHRRRGRPSAETTSLLATYQAAMRDELRDLLRELKGTAAPPGLLDTSEVVTRPSLADRMRLWDLAIKVGRELGTEVDGSAATDQAPPPAPRKRSRARIDYG